MGRANTGQRMPHRPAASGSPAEGRRPLTWPSGRKQAPRHSASASQLSPSFFGATHAPRTQRIPSAHSSFAQRSPAPGQSLRAAASASAAGLGPALRVARAGRARRGERVAAAARAVCLVALRMFLLDLRLRGVCREGIDASAARRSLRPRLSANAFVRRAEAVAVEPGRTLQGRSTRCSGAENAAHQVAARLGNRRPRRTHPAAARRAGSSRRNAAIDIGCRELDRSHPERMGQRAHALAGGRKSGLFATALRLAPDRQSEHGVAEFRRQWVRRAGVDRVHRLDLGVLDRGRVPRTAPRWR